MDGSSELSELWDWGWGFQMPSSFSYADDGQLADQERKENSRKRDKTKGTAYSSNERPLQQNLRGRPPAEIGNAVVFDYPQNASAILGRQGQYSLSMRREEASTCQPSHAIPATAGATDPRLQYLDWNAPEYVTHGLGHPSQPSLPSPAWKPSDCVASAQKQQSIPLPRPMESESNSKIISSLPTPPSTGHNSPTNEIFSEWENSLRGACGYFGAFSNDFKKQKVDKSVSMEAAGPSNSIFSEPDQNKQAATDETDHEKLFGPIGISSDWCGPLHDTQSAARDFSIATDSVMFDQAPLCEGLHSGSANSGLDMLSGIEETAANWYDLGFNDSLNRSFPGQEDTSATYPPLPELNFDGGLGSHLPIPARTSTRTCQRDAARDELLILCKSQGMSYKEIKAQYNFTEAESTLRGRYRALTKPKNERVRKPEWKDSHVRLLREAVQHFSLTHGHHISSFSDRRMSIRQPREPKIPWKQVAEYMAARGSYKYGNATVKKKYLEIMRGHGS